MFTGIAAARKYGTYTRKRVKEGLMEKLLLILILLTTALVAKALNFNENMFVDISTLISIVFSILIVTEAVSIIGNAQKHKRGVKIIKLDVYTLLVEKLLKPIAKHLLKGGEDVKNDK